MIETKFQWIDALTTLCPLIGRLNLKAGKDIVYAERVHGILVSHNTDAYNLSNSDAHNQLVARAVEALSAHSDDADQPFQRIPISHSDRSRSVWCGVSAPLDAFLFQCSVVASSTVEPVPVVNRRDPRATRSDPPSQTQRRAREVPVDPRGRAVGHGGHFLIPFVGLVDKALALSAAFAGAVASAASGFRIDARVVDCVSVAAGPLRERAR